jgi:hypothetical protein
MGVVLPPCPFGSGVPQAKAFVFFSSILKKLHNVVK